MSTRALRQVLASTPCSHVPGCDHCHAKSELSAIERAALVTMAGSGATEAERQSVVDLLLFIAEEWLRARRKPAVSEVDAKEAA